MWVGLTARRANRAGSATVARVLVLPAGLWAGMILLASFTGLWFRLEDKWQFYLALWFALGIGVDVFFGLRARLCLLRDLRTVATQRFVPGRPIFYWMKPGRRQSSPSLPPAIATET